MNQKLSTGAVIILLLAITAVFAYYKLSGAELPVSIPTAVTHPVEPVEAASAVQALNKSPDKVLEFRIPATLSWKKGETGSFLLGIKNIYQEAQTFHIAVSLESFSSTLRPATHEWIIFQPRKTLQAGEIGTVTLIARPLNPKEGSYLFRIVVCETASCSINSPSLYATTTFAFRIAA